MESDLARRILYPEGTTGRESAALSSDGIDVELIRPICFTALPSAALSKPATRRAWPRRSGARS